MTEASVGSIDHDLVILGGGPAGLTAGLYAARSRLDVVLLGQDLRGAAHDI
jgi:thioredoxin reductase (NADPH)